MRRIRSPNRPWVDRRGPGSWESAVVALAITAVMFASAFIAMRSVSTWDSTSREPREAIEVRLEPPVPATIQPKPRVALPKVNAVPTGVPAPPAAVVPSVAEPIVTRTADTTSRAPIPTKPDAQSPIETRPVRTPPTFTPGGSAAGHAPGRAGAPMAPSGVGASSTPLSAAARDSINEQQMLLFQKLSKNYKPTEAEKEAVRQQNEPGLPKYGRAARMPGGAVSAPLMSGGFAVAYPMVSIPVGRTMSDSLKKRLAAADAENLARIRRMQDLIRLRRDSVRADSIRADSLHRDSLAKTLRRP